MCFKFFLSQSRIYDFLFFPSLVFYLEEYNNLENGQNYKELVTDSYLAFVKKVEDKLRPYMEDIEVFYTKQLMNQYDFMDLISKANSIFNYRNEKEYLDMLLSLSEKEVNRSIIYSLMLIGESHNDYGYSDEVMEKAEEISRNKDQLITYIKDLPIEAAQKWNLFLILEQPLKYMKKYVELMLKLLPVFEEIYFPYEDEVKTYGKSLVDFLNENGTKGLDDISYSLLNTEVIDEKEINIIISIMFSYAISIVTDIRGTYLAWGLKMEEAFKAMKEINENKTNARVQIFKNLGDKTRYEVLKLIASGETSTKKIAKALGVSSATVSYHISNFLTSKVIKMDKTDNKCGYAVDYELLEEALKALKEDLKFPK
ncbi:MAG TPA: winged helix-turn-helix domain-containing protein [Clostridiales bacterium]|nr:winged helix-turn-helix domain-containing protein [Clostridiales bacterium]